jgi:hypothetical protein
LGWSFCPDSDSSKTIAFCKPNNLKKILLSPANDSNMHRPSVLIVVKANYPVHGDEIKEMLTSANARLATFLPHTSIRFHSLDLATFNAFKREKREITVKLPEESHG